MLQSVKNFIKKNLLPTAKLAKKKIDKQLFLINGSAQLDFEFETLPPIDKGVSIDEIVKGLDIPEGLPYNLQEKLAFFEKNGYVVLEQIIKHEDLDKVWEEIDDVFHHNEKYEIEAIAHRFNNQALTPVSKIPKEKINGIGSRLNDFHECSVKTQKLSSNPFLRVFLEGALEKHIAVFQSLVFKYSSQQAIHQDFPWVTSPIPSHLAAAWIPFEDVHPDSGPLVYYPGSHRMPKFDFGKTGILYKHGQSLLDSEKDFTPYLEKTLKKHNYNGEILLIKKGDVLIWHGALVHGGTPIKDPNKTRKSLVVHYSSAKGLPNHRYAPTPKNEFDTINNVRFYHNNQLPHLKNIFK